MMGQLDVDQLKEAFISLVNSADPDHLSTFFIWLDLKVAQFKISGFFIPDSDHKQTRQYSSVRKLFSDDTDSALLDLSSPRKPLPQTQSESAETVNTSEHQPGSILSYLFSKKDLPGHSLQKEANSSSISSQSALSSSYILPLVTNSNASINNISGSYERNYQSSTLSSQLPDSRSCQSNNVQVTCASIYGTFKPRFKPIAPRPVVVCPEPGKSDNIVNSLLRQALVGTGSCETLSRDAEEDVAKDVGDDLSGLSSDVGKSHNDLSGISNDTGKSRNRDCVPGSCPYCGKTFQYRSSYRRHVKIHEGIFSHECHVCGRKFTRKEHYVRHKCNRRPNKRYLLHDTDDSESTALQQSPKDVTGTSISASHNTSQLKTVQLQLPADDIKSVLVAFDIKQEVSSDVDIKVESCDESSEVLNNSELVRVVHESRRKSSTPRKVLALASVKNEGSANKDICMDTTSVNDDDGYDDDDDKDYGSELEGQYNDGDNGYNWNQVDNNAAGNVSVDDQGFVFEKSDESNGHIANNDDKCSTDSRDNQSGKSPNGNGLSARISATLRSCVLKTGKSRNLAKTTKISSSKTEALSTGYDQNEISENCSSDENCTGNYENPGSLTVLRVPEFIDGLSLDNMNNSDVPLITNGDYMNNFHSTTLKTRQRCGVTSGDVSVGMESDLVSNSNCKNNQNVSSKSDEGINISVDGTANFQCPNCDKLFHRSSNFSRHMRIHRGVYSYVCTTCTRGFFRREHFAKHKCNRKSLSAGVAGLNFRTLKSGIGAGTKFVVGNGS